MKKALSYSEYWLYMNRHEEHHIKYVLGGDVPIPEEDKLKIYTGTAIHQWMADPTKVELSEKGKCGSVIERFRELEYSNREIVILRKLLDKAEGKRSDNPEVMIRAMLGDIELFGIFDGLHNEDFLREYKTGPEDKWEQWMVDYNEQLSLYALMYKLTYHKYFKGINLYAMNTTKGTCKTFKTARGPMDIKHMKNKVIKCVESMKDEGIWHKRLSREERNKINQKKLLL